jgi:hypothetical protein
MKQPKNGMKIIRIDSLQNDDDIKLKELDDAILKTESLIERNKIDIQESTIRSLTNQVIYYQRLWTDSLHTINKMAASISNLTNILYNSTLEEKRNDNLHPV